MTWRASVSPAARSGGSASSIRRAAIAKVKIACKALAIDDPTYRAMLERLTGRRSAAECSDAELGRVLDELKAKGWTPSSSGRGGSGGPAPRKPADHPSARKARALWLSLWNLGVVRDPSEAALESFAARQLKVDRLQWADQGQCFRLIEALKAMAERAGWSQRPAPGDRDADPMLLKRRLIDRQVGVLGYPAIDPDFARDEATLNRIITDLGQQIRDRTELGALGGAGA